MRIILIVLSFSFLGCASVSSSLKKTFGSANPDTDFQFERRWAISLLSQENLENRLQHRMSPIVTERVVYQGNAKDGMTALNRETGEVIWKLQLEYGVEASAVLADGFLYFGASDGNLYSVNAETGAVKWTFGLRAEGVGQPLISGGVVYVLAGNNVLYAVDAKTGQQKWLVNRQETTPLSVRGGAQPVRVGDSLLVGFSDGYLVSFRASDGTFQWERSLNQNKRFRDVDATPVVDGNRIYVSSYDLALYCLDAKTGNPIWTFSDGGVYPVTVTPEWIFYATSTGRVVRLNKTSGQENWSYKVPSGIPTQPRLFRDLVLFGESDGALVALNSTNGSVINKFFPGRGLMSSPTVDSETGDVFFVSSNANLWRLKMTWFEKGQLWPWEKPLAKSKNQ